MATMILGAVVALLAVGVVLKLGLDGAGVDPHVCPYCASPVTGQLLICPQCHRALGKR